MRPGEETSLAEKVMAQGADKSAAFFSEALSKSAGKNLDIHVRFVNMIITSVAESATDDQVGKDDLFQKADILADMIIGSVTDSSGLLKSGRY
jgi:hypothetical protein